MESRDHHWLRRVIALSRASREGGKHPFAALIVDADDHLLVEATNASHEDRTAHAEMVALRAVSAAHAQHTLRAATLYSSAEPCAMCAGGAYWVGVGRIVYALSETRLLDLTGNDPENPTLSLPCREVLARGQRRIEVVGPLCEDEAAAVHAGFWKKT